MVILTGGLVTITCLIGFLVSRYRRRAYCKGNCGGSGRKFIGSKRRNDPQGAYDLRQRGGMNYINYYRICETCGGTGRKDGSVYIFAIVILILTAAALAYQVFLVT